MPSSYRYVRDPLFVACLVLYAANRWLLKPLVPVGFFHDHLNDLICIPFWVPLMLWSLRRLGLRGDDDPPRWYEVIFPLVVWSAVFELLLPRMPLYRHLAIGDPADILFYTLGALGSALYWKWWYGQPGETEHAV